MKDIKKNDETIHENKEEHMGDSENKDTANGGNDTGERVNPTPEEVLDWDDMDYLGDTPFPRWG